MLLFSLALQGNWTYEKNKGDFASQLGQLLSAGADLVSGGVHTLAHVHCCDMHAVHS